MHIYNNPPIMEFFDFQHLSPELREVAEPISDMAYKLLDEIPQSEELSAGLRKLLEAKDCLVRAKLSAMRKELNNGSAPNRQYRAYWLH